KVRPRANILSYYEKILATDFRTKEIKNLSEQKKKIIGTFCNFVPEELIYACGCVPEDCAQALAILFLQEKRCCRGISAR
ncbi:MAG: hypothetical protein KKA80_00755, partial [Candidatus Omnitrophica bacterium]|nr:hypothetical protein [Candidatus Omnitrophota bacterium]